MISRRRNMSVAAEFNFKRSSSDDKMRLGKTVLLKPRMESHFVDSAISNRNAGILRNFDTGPAVWNFIYINLRKTRRCRRQ